MSVLRKLVSHSTCRRAFVNFLAQNRSYVIQKDFVVTSNLPPIDIPSSTLEEVVFKDAGKWGNWIAVECGVSGRKMTYDQLRKKISNFSKCIRKKLKLQPQDVVALFLPNIPEFFVAAYGTIQAGLIITTLNPLYTPDEIAKQLKDSGAKVIITINELYPSAKAAFSKLQMNAPILTVCQKEGEGRPEGAINFTEFMDDIVDIADPPSKNTNEICFMPYSSGTTGLPKGVELSNYNLVANLLQFSGEEISIFDSPQDYQDTVPAVLPLFHIYGFTSSAGMFHKGCKVVTLPKFVPELYLKTLINYKPDCLVIVPPIVLFLTAHPAVKAEYLKSVRTVLSGAAPLGALDEENFLAKANRPIRMIQGYGLSETSPVVAMISKLNKAPGSIGEPVSNTCIKVVSVDDGQALGPNKVGELLVKGPQVMKCYHNRPEETKNTFTEDGYLRTGDMAYYTENQMLFITDRIKELIKVKGFQVPPAELEEILRDFEGVGDAAVIGIPHDMHGEVPRAYVVPKPNQKLDGEKLKEYVASKVTAYKCLAGGVVICDSIPKTATGKILRRELKDNYLKTGV